MSDLHSAPPNEDQLASEARRDQPSAPPRAGVYRKLFEHLLQEVHMWELVRDEDGRIQAWTLVDANPAALAAWGRSLDEIMGKTPDEIFPGSGATALFMPIVEKIFETGRPQVWESAFPKTKQVLRMVSVPMGELFFSAGLDISERERKELDLRDTKFRLREAVAAGNVGLWEWDLLTHEVSYSREWKRQLGYEEHEIEDEFEEWRRRIHPEDLDETLDTVAETLERGAAGQELVFRLRHKDGSYRWIFAHASLVKDEEGRPIRMLGSHIDITERKQLESRLQQARRIESLATLAGGIAHDFNNMLTGVLGNLSIAKEILAEDSEAFELVDEAEQASRRARSLTTQLLTFSKGGAPVKEIAALDELVEESARFAARGTRARLDFALAPELPAVNMDVGQVSQVIHNLVLNASEAMPKGGRIRVEVDSVELGPDREPPLAPGRYLQVRVEDQGVGIPDEHLSSVFDPYFSSKRRGSGLGLSTAHSIVEQHGGRIAIRSQLGVGTMVRVLLPASEAEIPEQRDEPILEGEGRVLAMDDDPMLRRLLERMLLRLGYTPRCVEDGPQLLRAYESARRVGEPYDAVILDLTGPGDMGGEELLARLAQLDPEVRAIVASGYADNPVLARYQDYGFAGMIHKPFDAATLGRELRRVLEG